MSQLKRGNRVAMLGLIGVLCGGSYIMLTANEARKSPTVQLFDVWPNWMFWDMAMGFGVLVLGITVTMLGLRMGGTEADF